jgi:hypothetical protein
MQSLDDVALFVCMMAPMVDEKSRCDVVLSEITAGIVPSVQVLRVIKRKGNALAGKLVAIVIVFLKRWIPIGTQSS